MRQRQNGKKESRQEKGNVKENGGRKHAELAPRRRGQPKLLTRGRETSGKQLHHLRSQRKVSKQGSKPDPSPVQCFQTSEQTHVIKKKRPRRPPSLSSRVSETAGLAGPESAHFRGSRAPGPLVQETHRLGCRRDAPPRAP